MKKFLKCLSTILLLGLLVIVIYLFVQVMYVTANPISISMIRPSEYATEIYDDQGNLVTKLGIGIQKATYTSNIPENMKNSFIAIEDKRFNKHFGVDVYRTFSAIGEYIVKFGNSDYGGSTITQQLVKNATGEDKKNINRKVREWFYAINLEQNYSKDEIITHYSNIVYMGRGIYGTSDAAKYYFEKDLSKLTVAEFAFLAGLVKSPELYIKDNKLANERKTVVLQCMFEQGMIDEAQYKKAKMKNVVPKISSRDNIQTYFEDAIIFEFANYLATKERISDDEAISEIYQGGYKIYATMNKKVQNAITSKYENMDLNGLQSGIAVISVDGKVLGISGGVGKKTGDLVFNRATALKRQTGSSVKPLSVYAPCFEHGVIDNTYLMEDKAIAFGNWNPKNYYSGYRGYMTIRKAVEISCNTIPVQLVDILGVDKSFNTLQEMNFNLPKEDMNLSAMALGGMTYGVSPLQMASGYQALANKGLWCEPVFYTKIIDKNGKMVYEYTKEQHKKQIFSEQTAYLITDLLKSVVSGSEGTARALKSNYPIAAKTGTATDAKDKWLCAYTTDCVCATWYGYDKPQKVSYSSTNIAKNTKPILDIISTGKDFDIPSDIKNVNVCNESWNIATENCTNTRQELIDINKSTEYCKMCKRSNTPKVEKKVNEEKSTGELPNVHEGNNNVEEETSGESQQATTPLPRSEEANDNVTITDESTLTQEN